MSMERLKLNTTEANQRALEIRRTADEMDDLLKKISTTLDKINDPSSGVYYGSEKAVKLGQALEPLMNGFPAIYEQIKAESDLIITTIKTEIKQ